MNRIEVKEELDYIEKISKINAGKNLKYFILTMGCQLNENDSEKICGMLEQMGYKPTDDIQEANLAVFNTFIIASSVCA